MKIALGYDGSKTAMDALNLAAAHAKAFNGKVYVIQSLMGGEEDSAEKVTTAEQQLQFAEDLLKKEGVLCETHLLIRMMSPGEDIVAFSRENGIDLIVIGIKRRSKVGKMIFGSNAQHIILNAPCPVLSTR